MQQLSRGSQYANVETGETFRGKINLNQSAFSPDIFNKHKHNKIRFNLIKILKIYIAKVDGRLRENIFKAFNN